MTTASPRRRTGAGLSRGVEKPEIGLAAFPHRVPYREGLELQRRLARDRVEGREDSDLLLLMEHDPVLTLGRGTDLDHLTARAEELEARGVDAVEIERGGDVTYHGPGQLVGYPILDLRRYRQDLHWYLRALEEALIRALDGLGLPAFRVPEHTGVWVGDRSALDGPAITSGRIRKVASIGVHVSRWITWHGFALNVRDRALESFDLIVPCGIRDVRMTSMESEGVGVGPGALAGPGRLREAVRVGFAAAFDARLVLTAPTGMAALSGPDEARGTDGARPDARGTA